AAARSSAPTNSDPRPREGAPTMPEFVASPCVGICRMDSTSGLCIGCARTIAEIITWRDASPDTKRRIWAELSSRRRIVANESQTEHQEVPKAHDSVEP
ncbi:DUF1289 domain-containing protein, partial [Singulisphaera rosea]